MMNQAKVITVAPPEAIVARHIRFLAAAPTGANVLREIRKPRPIVAVEEVIDPVELPDTSEWPEPTDGVMILLVPTERAAEARKIAERWMTSPSHPAAVTNLVFTVNGHRIQWRPGRAIVQGSSESFVPTVSAIIDFAFYEGELRRLEQDLEEREAGAFEDSSHAYGISFSERASWPRFAQMSQYFCRMRLTYARLEPCLVTASRSLSPEAREVMDRLLEEADVSERLEAFSNRLEACEDLYEGAMDRIAEHRWYLGGQWLELGIIFLLLIEIILMGTEFYLRHGK